MVSLISKLQRDVADRLESQLGEWVMIPVLVEGFAIEDTIYQRIQSGEAHYIVRVPGFKKGADEDQLEVAIRVLCRLDVAQNDSSTGGKVSILEMAEYALGLLDKWQPESGGWTGLALEEATEPTFDEPDRSKLEMAVSFKTTTFNVQWRAE